MVNATEKAPEQSGKNQSVKQDIKGQLIIIGGAEDKEGDCKILREFIRRSGGIDAKIVIMTVATELPREVGDDYIRTFERLGVEDVRVADTVVREDADSRSILEALERATGVFFTGGDQARIVEVLKDTQIHKTLQKRYQEGLIVGGTSAGASMMSDKMILEGDSETYPRIEIVDLDSGMDFLSEVIIDQHFAQRGRLGRLLAAVARHPQLIGIGIDENTGIIVEDHQFQVIGEGSCTVVDLKSASHNNIKQILKDEGLALCDVNLNILPDGYGFDLNSRKAIVA
ncbi:cyanophycinase [Gloeothece citriformis PCC 7424]|uniref:Cyanophycinase n=1 Tax=Gloeothece citriformis (strain PCC 7424) TaxID=65393 RepID=B7KFI4_GLOC7|nr:cyanophycinase [Gloeothece citriformis]ACK73309.1 cyanophycinase [Gloeothece citriformis PCC 7424]